MVAINREAPPPAVGMVGWFVLACAAGALIIGVAVLATRPIVQAEPITFGETYDAGPVFATESYQLHHKFRVHNASSSLIQIRNIRRDCTCTEVRFEPKYLRPGQSADLQMTVNVPHGFGARTVRCVLETDYPAQREWIYGIKFEPFLHVRAAPSVVELQQAGTESTPALQADAFLEFYGQETNGMPQPVLPFETDQLRIEAVGGAQDERLPSGVMRRRYALRINLQETRAGAGTRGLDIPLGNGSSAGFVVMWRLDGPLRITPNSVHFGMLSEEESATRSVVVMSRDRGPFRIETIDVGDAPIDVQIGESAELPFLPSKLHRITLTWKGSKTGSSPVGSGEVVLKTNLSTNQHCAISWSIFSRREAGPSRDRQNP